MELIDVFTAFAQTKTNCDEINMKNQEGGVTPFKHYEFGSIAQHEGNPCYKIDKNGKITLYWIIIEKKSKKEITY